MQNKFSIKNRKGLEIVGIVSEPENPQALAFVLHGLGGFKEQDHLMVLVEVLLKNNYIVVNFDATNSIGESGGKYEDARAQLHYEDLVDVISWAKTQNWYREPFVLAGHSLGGYAVGQYAEDYPQEVKGAFPYASLIAGELWYKAYEKFIPEDLEKWKETGWYERKSVSKPDLGLKRPYALMEESFKHDLRLGAAKLTMPVLFVVGENDQSCPPESQKALHDLVPGPKEIHVIPGAPHTFREKEHLNMSAEIFENWLKKLE